MAAYRTFALYTVEGVGKSGLTVTVDVYRFTATGTKVVTDAAAIAIGGGYYGYIHNDTTEGDYLVMFKTTDVTVDAQELGAMMSREQVKIGLPVTLNATQGRITWQQMKFVDSREGQGVIDIMNNHSDGFGVNIGGMDTGWRAAGGSRDVQGFDPEILNSIKGTGFTTQTLVAISALLDAVKAKTDNLPSSPAATGAAMTLTSAYDKAKDDVVTPLAAVDALLDTLVERITASRAALLDNLNVSGTLAHTGNASSFKADVSWVMSAASYVAPYNAGIAELLDRVTASRAGLLDKLNVAGTLANTDNAATFKANVAGLATLTALELLQVAIGELIEGIPPVNLDALPTRDDLADTKGDILEAIEEKPVTPEVDTSELAKSSEVEAAKDAVISAMPEIDTTGLEGKIDDVKTKTDQLQFADGKVNANATVDLGELNIAQQRTSEQILSKFVDSGKVTVMRGNNWEIVIPCTLPEGVKYQFALKADKNKEDEKAALFVDSETGLTTLNGAPAADSALASVTYHEGLLVLNVSASATSQLPATNYLYGIQSSGYGSVVENHTGNFIVTPDIIRSIG